MSQTKMVMGMSEVEKARVHMLNLSSELREYLLEETLDLDEIGVKVDGLLEQWRAACAAKLEEVER